MHLYDSYEAQIHNSFYTGKHCAQQVSFSSLTWYEDKELNPLKVKMHITQEFFVCDAKTQSLFP